MAVELDRRRSDGVFASPFTCGGFISGTVSLVHMSNLRHQRVIRVGICEHGAYREQHFGDCQGWTPLVSENVKADTAVGVDVRMVDPSVEVDLWWLEGIVGREVNC